MLFLCDEEVVGVWTRDALCCFLNERQSASKVQEKGEEYGHKDNNVQNMAQKCTLCISRVSRVQLAILNHLIQVERSDRIQRARFKKVDP